MDNAFKVQSIKVNKDGGNITMLMGICTLDNGKMIWKMEKDSWYMKMEIATKATGSKVKETVKEFTIIEMEQSTRVIF